MHVWRICRKPHALTTLDGLGGLYTSGRWHQKGRPMIYTATSAALAALEVLVHVDPLTAPADLRLLTIDIPDDLPLDVLPSTQLPTDWRAVPAPAQLQSIGTSWLSSCRTAGLIVPSAVIPLEQNILLNPQHPEAQRLRIISDEDFYFDSRLLS
ncbi:RES family NAD+ phosphorylase [Cyanobium sp. AMD-g]|uniref:RES family NAD+ phosphorylase n=1 Tax=Cyanobium sp. AMD-g TaxID=2823699 RepID=UPI0020CFC557|nr:RES family NAD+ phosphorylase [Cyanobium sp. AMD-g]MCP9931475.1 RES family NAD+ phosphorylase [Cyanobium sp. AMD-g]